MAASHWINPYKEDALEERARTALAGFLRDVRRLPNETAKKERFVSLVSELFPASDAVTHLAAGAEKIVHVTRPRGRGRGFIDTYYGNAVIEFENSLRATGAHARSQLREYVSGLWRTEAEAQRPLVCVATDCLAWEVYRPALRAGVTKAEGPRDIELDLLRQFEVAEASLHDFWIWLTGLLFRAARNEPSIELFRLDFGASSLAFSEAMDVLRTCWSMAKSGSETHVAFDTWQRYLAVTYGSLEPEADLETLFLKHTYLASIARLLVWASMSRGRASGSLADVADGVLSGRYFHSRGIENLVEEDFFQWVRRANTQEQLAPTWERVLAQMLTYDLAHLRQDVLKGVYQELVDPKDRHDLGEYYTPDWLCERIVTEVLPESGFSAMLDPSCGSGSFLAAAIHHYRRSHPRLTESSCLRQVLDNVVGFDIHPLAVTIARATYVLALGPLARASRRPIQIPVYLADSLFLPTEVRQLELGETGGFEIRFGSDSRVIMPDELVADSELFDASITASTKVAVDHASTGRESLRSLSAYALRAVPAIGQLQDSDSAIRALWQLAEELAALIRRKKNSIWAFVIKNAYRPSMMREHFGCIVGNPPWLSYRYIDDPAYQAEVKKRAVDDYAIAPPSQKLFTQMELATVFLAHSLETFAQDEARLAFVMPRSILSADQHTNLRTRSYRARIGLDKYWDLRGVRPLFNVPACVLFATRRQVRATSSSYRIPAAEWSGVLPRRDVTWSEAKEYLHADERMAQLIYIGSRNALSTGPGSTRPNEPSVYAARFRQGATIVPRSCYFVALVEGSSDHIDDSHVYWVRTDPEQALSAKAPWDKILLEGSVEGRFLHKAVLPRNVLPFCLHDVGLVAIPVDDSGVDRLRVMDSDALRQAGFREMGAWMAKVEALWLGGQRAGDDSSGRGMSAIERLDYQRELSRQKFATRYLVVYNASGTDLCAAPVDRRAVSAHLVIDHKLYWAQCSSPEEASFLTAVLNSRMVNEAIKPFQSMGNLGERDIHKKVLDLPIPGFSHTNKTHQRLAVLGEQCAREAEAFVMESNLPTTLARQRAFVRERIAGVMSEIDSLVKLALAAD